MSSSDAPAARPPIPHSYIRIENAAPVFGPDGAPIERTYQEYLGDVPERKDTLVVGVDSVTIAVDNDVVPGGQRDYACTFNANVGGDSVNLCFWWCTTYDHEPREPFRASLEKLAAGGGVPVHHALSSKTGEFALMVDYDGKSDTAVITREINKVTTKVELPAKLLQAFLHLVVFGLNLKV